MVKYYHIQRGTKGPYLDKKGVLKDENLYLAKKKQSMDKK